MSIVKNTAVLLLSVCFLNLLSGQDKKQWLSDFKSNDWKKVKPAKLSLESLQGDVIPDLISLLDNKDKVSLENTGNLIYPGALKFYGHGQILDYDIDYMLVRAGWLLEEISFANFGFSGIHLTDDEARDFIKMTFPEYYNNSSNRKKIESAQNPELRKIITDLSVASAKAWWASEKTTFSRLNSLVEALQSFDEKQQVKALFYLRNGRTRCDGLTREYYYNEIIKEVGRLSGSDVQRISENAKLILLDTKLEWLSIKTGE